MVPDKVKGRVFAFEFAALTLTESISVLAAGYFQDTFAWSLIKIAFIFGWFGVAVWGIWLFFFLLTRKRLNMDEEARSEISPSI
jgi:hypothetical protein